MFPLFMPEGFVLNKLVQVIKYLGIFDEDTCILKTDANINVVGHPRIEVKNITGFKEIEKALNYEVTRQRAVIKRGIKATKVFPRSKLSRIVLEYKGEKETIFRQCTSQLSYNAYAICKDKEMTRRFLKIAGIKTTEGEKFKKSEIKKAIEFANKNGFPVVIKPVDGTWGKNVYLGIDTAKAAIDAISNIIKKDPCFLVEKQFEGNEYRVLATKEKLLGIINRVPANIIGDGKSKIKELIEIKNSDPRRGGGHTKSLIKIEIDTDVMNNLKKQGLSEDSIPKKGQQIFLRKNSNLSTGGDSFDITDEVHPKIKKLAPKVIAAIPGLPYGGFDLLTPEAIAQIVDLQVIDVVARLNKKEIALTISKEVRDYLAKEGYDPKFGARPLRRLIQSKILTPIANMMVGEGMLQGGTVKVTMKKGELDFDIKKKGRRKKVVKAAAKSTPKKKQPVTA